ncbi:MAG: SDR family oxidoreductase [Bacteroidia bacterium]
MKRLLVTGSNGLLGQKIIYRLLELNEFEIHAAARGENRLIETNGYTYHTLDIGDKTGVEELIGRIKPDAVIHTAAMTNVDACESDREGCLVNNVHAVEYFVDACNTNNAHLVHVSTDFIFDGEDGPYDEEAEPNPVSYYGWSKMEAERIVMEKSENWAILRTILVFGVVDHMSRSNVVLWAKSALEKSQQMNVVDDQFRMPTLAEDLAEGCILAARQHAKGIYNISGKDYMSVLELVERVADFYQLPKNQIKRVSSSTLNQPAKRPPKTGFILTKAINKLGYNPHSFEEGLAILDEQLKNQPH